jgi:hypothetical protein
MLGCGDRKQLLWTPSLARDADLLTRDVSRVPARTKGTFFRRMTTSPPTSLTGCTRSIACRPRLRSRSVLLHLAWKLPSAELVGVEAQDVSFEFWDERERVRLRGPLYGSSTGTCATRR